MALFIITIQCDGDAFHNVYGAFEPNTELASILGEYVDKKLRYGEINTNLYDHNGNKVGTALLGRRSGT